MDQHFILDYETIGQDVFTAPVVNCAYFIFDWSRFTSDEPYTFNELIKHVRVDKFDIKSQMNRDGCSFKKSDLEFWNQNPEAKKQITPSDEDITLDKFVKNVYDYVYGKKIVRWWSRSNTFDPLLLHRNFRDYWTRHALDEVLPFWLARDIRTFIDTSFDFKMKYNNFCPIDNVDLWNQYFIPHNSVHDVAADVLRLQRIVRTIHS